MEINETKSLEHLVIKYNPQARITYELACQVEPHLPIGSFEYLMEKLGEVVLDNQRLPLKIFAPYVSKDLFPIENIEDLVRNLGSGVQTAIALAKSPSFQIKNSSALSVLTSALQEEPGRRSATPIVFAGVGSLSPNKLSKGGV